MCQWQIEIHLELVGKVKHCLGCRLTLSMRSGGNIGAKYNLHCQALLWALRPWVVLKCDSVSNIQYGILKALPCLV